MNPVLLNRVCAYTAERREAGLYRQRKSDADDRHFLNFSSNDYLSLASHPALKKAYQLGCERYPVGSGGSPLVNGYHPIHRQLEQHFSTALGVDDALLFSSGYAANVSVMTLFAHLQAFMLIDKSMHASIYDGLSASGARFERYRHTDTAHLKEKITSNDAGIILTESVFSMSGQVAPLRKIADIAAEYHFDMCVDEAHAFGVVGPEGLGLVHALNLSQQQVPLRIIPLGKAFAASGAIVAGQRDWIDALLQSARPYTYSTAPSPAFTYGLLQTLDIIRAAADRREGLQALIAYFRNAIRESPWDWCDSTSAIQQLKLGCPHRAITLSEQLYQQSILCLPMRQPTVSQKDTGLRVIFNYHHQAKDIDRLLAVIDSCLSVRSS